MSDGDEIDVAGFDAVDDERWPDEDEDEAPRQGVPPVALVFGAIAVLALIIVLVATGGSSSDDSSKDETAKTRPDGTTTTVAKGPTWSAVVQGRPAVFGATGDPIIDVDPEAAPGVYVWTDYDGWHAWVVDPQGKAAGKGTLTSNVPFTSASTALAGQGVATLEGNGLAFDVTQVDAKAAGVNFDLGFYADELTINLDGTDLPLYLGSEAKESPLPAVISKAVPSN